MDPGETALVIKQELQRDGETEKQDLVKVVAHGRNGLIYHALRPFFFPFDTAVVRYPFATLLYS